MAVINPLARCGPGSNLIGLLAIVFVLSCIFPAEPVLADDLEPVLADDLEQAADARRVDCLVENEEPACLRLARLHMTGGEGIEQDVVRAEGLFQLLCEAQSEPACRMVAYLEGKDISCKRPQRTTRPEDAGICCEPGQTIDWSASDVRRVCTGTPICPSGWFLTSANTCSPSYRTLRRAERECGSNADADECGIHDLWRRPDLAELKSIIEHARNELQSCGDDASQRQETLGKHLKMKTDSIPAVPRFYVRFKFDRHGRTTSISIRATDNESAESQAVTDCVTSFLSDLRIPANLMADETIKAIARIPQPVSVTTTPTLEIEPPRALPLE